MIARRSSLAVGLAFAAWMGCGLVARADGPIDITYVALFGGATSLLLTVQIESTFETQRVTAHLGGTDIELRYSANDRSWLVQIDLAALGLPPGDTLLGISAEDALGNVDEAEEHFLYAPPPAIHVAAPIENSVATPRIHVEATCEDVIGGPCVSLRLDVRSLLLSPDSAPVVGPLRSLVQATTSIDQDVDLSLEDGTAAELTFTAAGITGTVETVTRQVWVEASPFLEEVERVQGVIERADGDSLLLTDLSTTAYPYGLVVKLRDRTSGFETPIADLFYRTGLYETLLTANGAIFLADDPNLCGLACLLEWRDDGLLELDAIPYQAIAGDPGFLRGSGDWAIWNVGATLMRRDVVAGTSETIANDAAAEGNAIAANGDVVYWTAAPEYEIERWREGQVEEIASADEFFHSYPITDGTGILYRRQPSSSDPPRAGGYVGSSFELVLHTEAGNETLVDEAGGAVFLPERDYRIENGWAAYVRSGNSGQVQVWLRDPSGAASRKTFYSAGARIASLSGEGQLSFTSGRRHYLLPPDSPDGALGIDIGADTDGELFKRTLYVGDDLFVHLGGSLFRVTALEDLDADELPNHRDNCPADFNPEQMDVNQDGQGEPCGCAWVGEGVTSCDFTLSGGPAPIEIADATHVAVNVWVRNQGCEGRSACASPGDATEVGVVAGGLVGGWLVANDSSRAIVLGGVVQGSGAALGSASVEVRGGSVQGGLVARGDAWIRWKGGSVGGPLVAYDDAVIEIVGDDFAVDGVPVALGDLGALFEHGVLSGRLATGDLFSVSFFQGGYSGDVTGTIRLIPEPRSFELASAALLGLTALAARPRAA